MSMIVSFFILQFFIKIQNVLKKSSLKTEAAQKQKKIMNTTTISEDFNLTEILNNSSENNSAENPAENGETSVINPGYFYQVEQLTFLWILFSLIVIGNATVLIALIVSKGRKSRMNFFIKHLAAADLCVGLISVLTDIIWKITISWEAGLIACKLISFMQEVVTYFLVKPNV